MTPMDVYRSIVNTPTALKHSNKQKQIKTQTRIEKICGNINISYGESVSVTIRTRTVLNVIFES